MAEGDFWDDQEAARALMGELKKVNRLLKPIDRLDGELEEIDVLFEDANSRAASWPSSGTSRTSN